MQNRSRLEISLDILQLLQKKPLPKTYIMYGAKLSYDQLRQYLDLLLRFELIEEKKVPEWQNRDLRRGRMDALYNLSLKGGEALRHLERLEEMLPLRSFNEAQKQQEVFA